MADPRIYLAPQSPLCKANSIQQQTSAGNFINSIGKIGDIAALNAVGGGKIGHGLRTLTNISNAIRSGSSVLPSSLSSSLVDGTNWVLDSTGIASSAVNALSKLNPTAANLAYGAASRVFSQVKNGTFTLDNIPAALQELQNTAKLASNIFTPANSGSTTQQICMTSPYAMDLVAHAPKHKFMFVVSFLFEDGYTQALNTVDFAFVVYESTRPSIKFKQADVNYYNYRTHIITKTEFDPMKMTFYDDMTNFVTQFTTAYTSIMSPITNHPDSVPATTNGMDWQSQVSLPGSLNSITAGSYRATRGPLMGDVPNPIKSIRLFHVFNGGRYMNVYQFLNPWITELSADDVTMEGGTNKASVTFVYDSVYIDLNVPFNSSVYNLTSATQNGAAYPLQDPTGSTGSTGSGPPATSPLSIPSTNLGNITSLAQIDAMGAAASANLTKELDAYNQRQQMAIFYSSEAKLGGGGAGATNTTYSFGG